MRWLIDYDSTLAQTFGRQIEEVNRAFGTSYTEEDFHSWNTDECLSQEMADYMWSDEVFFNTEFQLSVPPVPHAIESLREILDSGQSACVVTDRRHHLHAVTREWLDDNGLSDVPVFFTRSRESRTFNTKAQTKSQVAWNRRLTHVVEDAPHHSLGLANRSYIEKVWLLDKAYNRHINHPKIQRISSWEEVT